MPIERLDIFFKLFLEVLLAYASVHSKMDASNNNYNNHVIEGYVQVPELKMRETSKVAVGGSCQVLKSPSEIVCQRAITKNKNKMEQHQHHQQLSANGNYSTDALACSRLVTPSGSGISRVKDDDSEEIMETGLLKPFVSDKDTNDDAVSMSSVQSSNPLCKVDEVMDFWMVDEELVGKFQISTFLQLTEDPSILPNQIAVIFKVKTTSPYNYWVRPAVGLMRPNVICTVEVLCDAKASRTTMSRDEFYVEIAPVPGASTEMTSDLYTSSVPSNLPELLNIWDKVEEEVKQNNLVNSIEYHRISCRFRRTPLTLSLKSFEDETDDRKDAKQEKLNEERTVSNFADMYNRNVKTFEFEHDETPIQGFSHDPPKAEIYMAREYHAEADQKQKQRKILFPFKTRPTVPDPEERAKRQCATISRLKTLNITLAVLLMLSLGFIVYLSPIDMYLKL